MRNYFNLGINSGITEDSWIMSNLPGVLIKKIKLTKKNIIFSIGSIGSIHFSIGSEF